MTDRLTELRHQLDEALDSGYATTPKGYRITKRHQAAIGAIATEIERRIAINRQEMKALTHTLATLHKLAGEVDNRHTDTQDQDYRDDYDTITGTR